MSKYFRNIGIFFLFFNLMLPMTWADGAGDFSYLLEQIASQKQVRATFVEKKYIKGITVPIESSGELFFSAPLILKKTTFIPKLESLVFEGNQITLVRNGNSRTITIKDVPELAINLEGVRALLLGDRATLEKYYKIQLTGNYAAWKLRLIPLESRTLKHLEFSGNKVLVNSVEVQLHDGDSSIMQVTKIEN